MASIALSPLLAFSLRSHLYCVRTDLGVKGHKEARLRSESWLQQPVGKGPSFHIWQYGKCLSKDNSWELVFLFYSKFSTEVVPEVSHLEILCLVLRASVQFPLVDTAVALLSCSQNTKKGCYPPAVRLIWCPGPEGCFWEYAMSTCGFPHMS
jgi:hypothetical protein